MLGNPLRGMGVGGLHSPEQTLSSSWDLHITTVQTPFHYSLRQKIVSVVAGPHPVI